jgi:hypothetical protein
MQKEIDNINSSNSSVASKLICVDLGCGIHKSEGFIGVDVFASDKVDVVADLNGHFPFPDNSVDLVKADNVIEHLPDRIHTMNEIWRILKPTGTVHISVPSTDGRGAFQDPTHVSFWNINSFMYYCHQYPAYLNLCKTYGFKGEFSIVDIKDVKSLDQVQVYAVLEAIKSEENINPLNLRNINLVIFPNWTQSMDVIFKQLLNVFKIIINHPKSHDIALLIDTHNSHLEDAQFLLADVLMNFCSEDNKEIEINDDNSPELNLLNIGSLEEYKGLLPVLYSRIVLEDENQEVIHQIGLERLPSYSLEELSNNPLDISISI